MTEPLMKYVDGVLVPMTDDDVASVLTLRAEAASAAGPVPVEISDRQFAHGLWKRDLISFDEAMAFVRTGTMPAALVLIVDGLPDAIRDDVNLMLAGATEFLRAHPAVAAIAAAFGWDAAATDDFWRFAAIL